jgi:hypothetical protein
LSAAISSFQTFMKIRDGICFLYFISTLKETD